MSETIPSRDSVPPEQTAKSMLKGVHQWVWPRKPLPSAKPAGKASGKGGRPGGPKPAARATHRRATGKKPLPGWDL